MGIKRQFGEEGSDNNSHMNNNNNSQNTKFRKESSFLTKDFSVEEIASKISTILEPALRKVVKEEVEPLIYYLQSFTRQSRVLQPESIPSRSLQLIFVNKLPPIVFTNSKIEDEEHEPLQIQLIDAQSRSLIQHGSMSSIKVEIFVLSGDFAADGREDWSESEFNDNILHEREGKRPLLVGELSITLVGGIGTIGNVTFTDNSSWVRTRKFKLGVRVASRSSVGTGIREAVTESFVVLDHRGESYQKHHTPNLDDPIWRLKKISKQGASHKKLEAKGIKTVKDFLIHYHVDSSYLRQVLGKGVPNKTWETMVKHANECHLDNTYYSYEAEGAQLLFNCVYKVVGAKFIGQLYQPVNTLDIRQKLLVEAMKQSAFLNLDKLVPVHKPSDISTIMPLAIEQDPFPSTMQDLQHDALSTIDQGEPEKQLDINLSDSASYPCTIGDGYLLDDDSASQTNQQMPEFTPATLLLGDSCTGPSSGACNWYQNNPMETFAQNSQFGRFCQLETLPFYPQTAYWGQGDEFLTSTTFAAHVGSPSQFSDPSVNMSGTGRSKAGWCKIRAAVKWKIVRRIAVARRKEKLSFGYN